jgi:hypothetical protein
MKYLLIMVFIILAAACSAGGNESSSGVAGISVIEGAKLPPLVKTARNNPKLVNYFHMDLAESHIKNREEMLAQWDIVILNPDNVESDGISLSRIRAANTAVKILAWVPAGQEPDTSRGIGLGVPLEENPSNWYGKSVGGGYLYPPWGGHMMNPCKQDYAWPKYIIQYVKTHYLDNNLYDGMFFDSLLENEPIYFAADNPKTFDVNEDGFYNSNDNQCYQDGMIYLMRELSNACPTALIAGNASIAWTGMCGYFNYADGEMQENTLGNEYGDYFATWSCLSNGIGTFMDRKAGASEKYYMMVADTINNRTIAESGSLKKLTDDDLRRFRLGLATALLYDCYFGFDRGDCLHGQLWWFDEYDTDMGEPKESCQQGVYGTQTYSREFDNGIVIVNHNPTATIVTLPYNCMDATTKMTGTSFSIPLYDGRILIRQ